MFSFDIMNFNWQNKHVAVVGILVTKFELVALLRLTAGEITLSTI